VIIEFDMQKPHSLEKEKLGPEWQLLKNTPAVKNGQVYIVGGSHTMIPGPRVTWLARDFQRIIDQVKNEERSHH
jgi:ABC-type Fe3+-hydroxamate transport system substrate-binding protein